MCQIIHISMNISSHDFFFTVTERFGEARGSTRRAVHGSRKSHQTLISDRIHQICSLATF